MTYQELEPGDLFIFDYPHHGEQLRAWVYIRDEEGYRKHGDDTLRESPTVSIKVILVPPDTEVTDHMVQYPVERLIN
ncbi:MAG TPA: hypothetical protein VJ742_12685 [Nitrososphaera sp.]|nr:hypothetical protein [Nitrososphaera sp.]